MEEFDPFFARCEAKPAAWVECLFPDLLLFFFPDS